MAKDKKQNMVKVDVVRWNGTVRCIYINDFRVIGEKPWGGGETMRTFYIPKATFETDLKEALSR